MAPDDSLQLDLSHLDANAPLDPGLARYLARRGVHLAPTAPPAVPAAKDQQATFFLSITGTPESVAESLMLLFDSPFGPECDESCGD
jgi:hypothetical protein